MFRILFVLFGLVAAQLVAMSGASAQQGHDACARDVSRFCRALMNDGDSVVLACLKQHRARLSRACDKVLTENGQ
jgi:Cysteine rich repeat